MAQGTLAVAPSSSPTLVEDPQHQPMTDLHSSSHSALTSTLAGSPHSFLQPPPSLYSAALVLAKRYLDPLASGVSQAQADRLQASRRKRKRSQLGAQDDAVPLKVEKLYLEGFSADQIWEQARRILDATRKEVERNAPDQQEAPAPTPQGARAADGLNSENGLKMVRFDEDGFELGDSDETDEAGSGVGSSPEVEEGVDEEELGSLEDDEGLEDEQDEDISEEGADGELDDEAVEKSSPEADEEPRGTFIPDPNGLNDGFFSIDDFNRQTGFLEHQDAAGDPNDGAASDEEEIDWDADPTTMGDMGTLQSPARRFRDTGLEEGGQEDDDEDGPTFGNADLNAPEGDSEEDLDADEMLDEGMASGDGIDNTNEVYYGDFFAPPPRKAGKRGRPSKHTREIMAQQGRESGSRAPPQNDVQRTIDAVRRDIFEDELSGDEAASEEGAQLDHADPRSRRSTHERRQAKIAEEIRKLEAANVAKRKWALAGEARASDRPVNSLLEEDLDFERTGKPVPVITAEVSEDIEEMIKRRILAQEFDEVLRRRPDSLATDPGAARRGRNAELDDNKAQQSLAEIYEEEHLRRVDPEGHRDKRDEKLRKEHAEIEALWADVSAKLDALSSWHYRPAPPKPSVNIVADVPTIAMEDARPTAAIGAGGGGADLGANSMLAPHEIYAPGQEKTSGDVVPKSGVPVAKEEMTREEKLRRRRREKERLKKRLGGKVIRDGGEGKNAKERQNVVGALKKGGAKVIGKKGDVRDVEGKQVKDRKVSSGGGNYKL